MPRAYGTLDTSSLKGLTTTKGKSPAQIAEDLKTYQREYARLRRQARPDVKLAQRKASNTYYANLTPEKKAAYGRRVNLHKYGLSPADYEQRFESQGGVCAICSQTSDKSLAVDHDHVTGVVRGLLCRECNLGLGHFEDDTSRMWAAFEYLLKHRGLNG